MDKKIFNIANFVTFLRFLLLPLIIYFIVSDQGANILVAGILFIISALTDFVDGYLARRLNICTDLGRLLDPLADKLTLFAVFVALLSMNFIPTLPGIIILLREGLVFALSTILFLTGSDMIHPSKLGKYTIALFYTTAVIFLLQITALSFIIWIATVLAILSSVDYLRIVLVAKGVFKK